MTKPNYHGSLLYTQVVLPSELSTLAGSQSIRLRLRGSNPILTDPSNRAHQ